MTTKLEDLVILDKWENMLQSLEPEYSILKQAMEIGPYIKPVISRRGRAWNLMLTEVWPDVSDGSYDVFSTTKTLDDAIEWATEELTKWPDCRRMAFDSWHFKYKRDAEKFITLFSLKWPV